MGLSDILLSPTHHHLSASRRPISTLCTTWYHCLSGVVESLLDIINFFLFIGILVQVVFVDSRWESRQRFDLVVVGPALDNLDSMLAASSLAASGAFVGMSRATMPSRAGVTTMSKGDDFTLAILGDLHVRHCLPPHAPPTRAKQDSPPLSLRSWTRATWTTRSRVGGT